MTSLVDGSASYVCASGGVDSSSEVTETPRTPAQYLQDLKHRTSELAAQHTSLRDQLREATAAACRAVAQAQQGHSTGIALPETPDALVDELAALNVARQYVQYLQELQALIRHTEKLVRNAERCFADGDPGTYLKELSDSVDSFSQSIGYTIALEQLTDTGHLGSSLLARHGASTTGRVQAVGETLRNLLSSAVQRRLKECAWPPPLIISGDSEAAASASEWDGFMAAGDAISELQHLFVIQITLQRAADHKSFSTLGSETEGPVLWPAEELATGVAGWLHHHFAQGLPTDRADKPEWLFAAVLKATRQCAPHAEVFQACVDAHGLQDWYSMQFEAARAVGAAAMAPILRSHVLPRLKSMDDHPSWLHYADEAMRFERAFASLRGAAAVATAEEDASTVAAHQNSALEVVFEEEEWSRGWLSAELEDAVRQIDAALEAPDAWRPAAEVSSQMSSLGLGLVGSDGTGGATPAALPDASQHEFFPPACADVIVALTGTLARRGAYLCTASHRARFASGVVHAALKAFRSRLSAMLVRAEQFDHLLDDAGLPKVGAIICAAHNVEHSLREPQGALLAALAGDDALGPAVEKEATALSTFRRQWAYKLAKLAVDQFQSHFAKYRRDLDAFALPRGEEESGLPSGPSRNLLPAAEGLQGLLRALSAYLDAVIFRDVWRAMTLAVNYAIFNDVATEGIFSSYGAAQLEVDLDVLVAVFGRCTSRPAAHFKESKEACRLLRLGRDDAAATREALQHGRPEGAAAALAAAGIKSLNIEQAATVLARRADLLE